MVVPVLTVLSQYVSMNLLQPPKDPTKEEDENQSVLLQLLPLFIGYISLTVPAGLTLYWLFNNIFTTATQVYLREGGGAVAKIEKSEDFKIKVPLGCAVVDPSIMDTKPRDAPYEGPYVIWGEGSAGNDTSGDVGGTDSADLASAAAGGSTFRRRLARQRRSAGQRCCPTAGNGRETRRTGRRPRWRS